jgi:calcineurin-like phosphoesterase family protein
MYQDKAYLDRANNSKDEEISYSLLDEIEVKIKTIIDEWLKVQVITLTNQDKIKTELRKKYDDLASNFKIIKYSDIYLKLFTEVMEMLSMRLAMISLMESISDDSFAPIPIK